MESRAKKYLPQLKRDTVKLARDTNIISASRYYKINRSTVRKWLTLYEKHGEEGVFYRKKRDDKQKKKVSDRKVKQIAKYKSENPHATLSELRSMFNLNCSIVLIDKKVKKYYLEHPSNMLQILNVSFSVLRVSDVLYDKNKLYQFNINDNISSNQFFGFCSARNAKYLCLFIDYVLGTMKQIGYLNENFKLVTNLKYLKKRNRDNCDYDRYVFEKHKVPLFIEKNKGRMRSKILKLSTNISKKAILSEAYEKIVLHNDNSVFIHPLIVGDNLGELEKHALLGDSAHKLLDNSPTELLEVVLKKIEFYGDNARIEFDFDKALELYNKIYLTCVNISDKRGEALKLNSLLKKALIFYHFDDYETAEGYFFDILRSAEEINLTEVIAEVYKYLGTIRLLGNNTDEADMYFVNSSGIYEKSFKKKHVFEYLEIQIKKHLNHNNYKLATRYANKYLATAKNRNNSLHICRAYDLKGIIYFYRENYRLSEKNFLLHLKYSVEFSEKDEEAKAINNLLNIYTSKILKPEDEIEKLLDQMRILSKEIKKEFYLFQAYEKLAYYNYYSNNFIMSAQYFEYARIGDLRYKQSMNYYRIIYFLACSHYYINNIDIATTYFKEVCENGLSLDYEHIAHAYNMLGRISGTEEKLSLSIKYFNASIRYTKIIKKYIIVADSYNCKGMVQEEIKNYLSAFNCYRNSLMFYKRQRNVRNDKSVSNTILELVEVMKTMRDQYDF